MLLNTKSLFDIEGFEQEFLFDLDISDLPAEIANLLSGPVKAVGKVFNRAGIVILTAVLTIPLAAYCDRCLKIIKQNLTIDINHTLLKQLSGEDELSDEYIEVGTEEFDLNELLISEVILNMPSKILCTPQCKGLCPKCGANLNEKACGCMKDNIDPRLEILKSLIDESTQSNND